jgi:hypothetical protein
VPPEQARAILTQRERCDPLDSILARAIEQTTDPALRAWLERLRAGDPPPPPPPPPPGQSDEADRHAGPR